MKEDDARFILLPEAFLSESIQNTQDIYLHRSLLKRLLLSEYTLNHLLDILVEATENRARFRTLDCIQVIKAILKNNPFGLELGAQTVAKLFYLYQHYVFHKNEEVQACANVLIRFQRLSDDQINWLISTWDKSEHSVNRLLRYPQRHPLIIHWAKDRYQQAELPERCAELVALLIDESIPDFVREDKNTIVWAIFYSRVSDAVKQKLLMERFSIETLYALREVSIRLRYPAVIEFMRSKLRETLKIRNGG